MPNSYYMSRYSGEEIDALLEGRQIATIKGNYATLAALRAAFPTGDAGAYKVEADGNVYVYNAAVSDWQSIGPIQGPQGPQGIQGETGEQGPQGEQGIQGIQGPKGDKGDKGDTGPEGPQGIQGEQGPQGIQGPQGETGATGPQGEQGPQGETGPQGEIGPKGETGPQGETGPIGPAFTYEDFTEQQLADLTGPQGPEGPQGPQGEQGEPGPQGPKGDPGDMSASVYDPQGKAQDIFSYADRVADEAAESVLPLARNVVLLAASWDSSALTQTVSVPGVLAEETAQLITPTPSSGSQTDYYAAGILCTAQGADSLTFTAKTIPTADLMVYVVLQEVSA